MTEEEARQKWCPWARCIGASCMAWRWEVTPGEIAAQATGKLQYTVLSHAPIGFCGLAGQP